MKHGQTLKTHEQEQRQGHSQDQDNTSKCKLQEPYEENYLLLLPPLMARMEVGTNENLYLLLFAIGAINHWPEGKNLYAE